MAFDIPADFVVHDVCHAKCKSDRLSSKGELTVLCPVTGKPFEINMAGGFWKCFRDCSDCPAGGKGGVLDFYMLYFPCGDRKDAAHQLQDMVKGGERRTFEQRRATALKPVKLVTMAPIEVRDATYRAFLNKLPLSSAHKADLLKRGLSEEDIERMMFRSIPQSGLSALAENLQEEGYTLKGVPGFYCTPEGQVTIVSHGSGYFIPYFDGEGRIAVLQIRYDVEVSTAMSVEEIEEAKKRRYRFFSSSGKEGGTAAANVPFYGIPGRKPKPTVYVTEGGLKAATATSLSNGWVAAIPGVSCYAAFEKLLQFFKEKGVTTVVDAFDSDRATNPNVAHSLSKLHKIAESYGIKMETWDWGTDYKGVDDFLLARKMAKLAKKMA